MAAERLGGRIRYVNNTDECRSRLLLNYFGQTDAADCGVCDICLAKRKSAAKEAEKMAEQKSVIIEK